MKPCVPLVACPHCSAKVRADRLPRHIEVQHVVGGRSIPKAGTATNKPLKGGVGVTPIQPQPKVIYKQTPLMLKIGELINAIPSYQQALNKALAELSETSNAASMLAARTACQEIQVILGRLVRLDAVGVEKVRSQPTANKPTPKRKKKVHIYEKGGSGWIVGTGHCRKPGSHRS